LAIGAAIDDRGDSRLDAGRSPGAGGREPAAGCAEPVAVAALWPGGSQRRYRCLLSGFDFDDRKRVALRDDPGATGVAEQSAAGDEERTGGFNAATSTVLTGSVVRRTN